MNVLSDIAFFVVVAKSGSLSAAAQELGVSTAAVSRRLVNLETRLGIRLLNRTTRRASLTHEGEIYLQEGKRILNEMEELEQRISAGHAIPRGMLRVNASLGFGRQCIAPAIADFVEKYPEVEVQMQLTDRPMNIIDEGFDVCIRFGDVPDARITSRKIASNRRMLCAAPAYLALKGEPQTPADLQRHNCIVIRESDETYGTWRLRYGSQEDAVKVRGTLATNDGESALNWTLRGLGILLRSEWHIAKYLRTGELREVLPEWQLPPADIHAVYPMKNQLSAKVRAFVNHLESSFEKYRILKDGDGRCW